MAKAEKVLGLKPETCVAEGLCLLVMSRFREFCGFREAALGGDSEGLHDMRIACRRLLWALREFRSFIPGRRLTRPRRALRKIAAALGYVREMDAAIAELEKLAEESPAEVSAGVRMLTAERRRVRTRARETLAERLRVDRLSRIKEELSRALSHAADPQRRRDFADRGRGGGASAFCELGRRVIQEHLSEMEEKGEGFFRPDNRMPLHRMRKAVRELRYALESFGPYWGGPAEFFDDELDGLQTALGKVHDLDVWVEELDDRLRSLAAQMPGETNSEEEWNSALWLLARHTRSRAKHFCEALALWSGWKARGMSERLGECIAADNPAGTQDSVPLLEGRAAL